MLLTVDASTLVGELLRRRGQELLSDPNLELFVPSRMWEETAHELNRRLETMVATGRVSDGVARTYLRAADRLKEQKVTEVPEPVYAHLEEEALARVPRDPNDWQVVALALLADTGILTADQDFFGCGVATWTAETLAAHLTRTRR